jgi:hypothetical protein
MREIKLNLNPESATFDSTKRLWNPQIVGPEFLAQKPYKNNSLKTVAAKIFAPIFKYHSFEYIFIHTLNVFQRMKHERCVTWLLSVKFLYSALESICSCYSSQHVLVVVHLRISQLINTCSHTLTICGCRIAKKSIYTIPLSISGQRVRYNRSTSASRVRTDIFTAHSLHLMSRTVNKQALRVRVRL